LLGVVIKFFPLGKRLPPLISQTSPRDKTFHPLGISPISVLINALSVKGSKSTNQLLNIACAICSK